MCSGNSNCGCGCASFEGNYVPEDIKNSINSNLYQGSGLESEVADSYVKTMLFFEKNNIEPSPEAVNEYKDDLLLLKGKSIEEIVAENEKKDEVTKKSSYKKLITFIAIVFAIYIAVKWMSPSESSN